MCMAYPSTADRCKLTAIHDERSQKECVCVRRCTGPGAKLEKSAAFDPPSGQLKELSLASYWSLYTAMAICSNINRRLAYVYPLSGLVCFCHHCSQGRLMRDRETPVVCERHLRLAHNSPPKIDHYPRPPFEKAHCRFSPLSIYL